MLNLTINPAREIDRIDDKIYGTFIENLCDCMYGGVYDPTSPAADEDGFRKDVIEACRRMGVSIARYPGGCFAPRYNWKEGIGPKEKRPVVKYNDVVIHGMEENNGTNQFGTDEFIKWCEKVGAEPYITVNMGNRDACDAADWVEYCNGSADTRWGAVRAQNGHPQPYGVKYWSLGNEISGSWELGYCSTSEEYIRRVKEYVERMKQADSSIRLVFNGCVFPLEGTVEERDWNRAVMEAYLEECDYISAHFYVGSCGETRSVYQIPSENKEEIHYRMQEGAGLTDLIAEVVGSDIRLINKRKDRTRPIGIALDEYNPWRRNQGPGETLDRYYDLTDALAVAEFFNGFLRHADMFKLCAMAQLVNVLPAMSCVSGTELFVRHGISYVQELYTKNKGNTAIDAFVDSPAYAGYRREQVPYVTCSASKTDDKIVVNLVNRHLEDAYEMNVSIIGNEVERMRGSLLVGDGAGAVNTFETPDAIRIVPADCMEGTRIKLPPLSVLVCEITVK